MADIEFIPEWLEWPEMQRVARIFPQQHEQMCYFGGLVRDTMLKRMPRDIDMLFTLPLPQIAAQLKQAGIENTLTAHAVIAQIGNLEFNFHSLRSPRYEPYYDPGHAFVDNVIAALASSDFTINAMFCNLRGEIFDLYDGISDLANGNIRFLGDPTKTAAQDPLLILRFFRFYANFSMGLPNQEGFAACQRHAKLTANITPADKYREMSSLLSVRRPYAALKLMDEARVLAPVFGMDIRRYDALLALEQVERAARWPASGEVKFALLLLSSGLSFQDARARIASSWALPKGIVSWLATVERHLPSITLGHDKRQRETVMSIGMASYNDLVLLRWAMETAQGAAA